MGALSNRLMSLAITNSSSGLRRVLISCHVTSGSLQQS
jgi:hypothetical protein